MKVGDLVEFSGEYYTINANDRWEWTISKLWKSGIITDINYNNAVYVISTGVMCHIKSESIKKQTAKIKVINSTD